MKTNVRHVTLAIVTAGVAAAFLFTDLRAHHSSNAAPARSTVAQSGTDRADDAPVPPEQPLPVWNREPLRTAPYVDAVTVDRPDVCAGEDALVTVRAHAVDGDDLHMKILIDNQEGAVVPVRPFLSDGKPHPVYARVIAKDGSETRVEVPLRAHDCRAPAFVAISTSALANAWDQYQLTARVLDAAVKSQRSAQAISPRDVESYTWDFGDGDTARTRVPLVEHSYEGRTQDRPSTSYLVKVEARLRDGRRITGRSSVALANPAFRAVEERGITLVMATLTPRFPVANPDGTVTQQVRLWHGSKQPVTVAGLARWASDKDGERRPPETLDASTVMGTTTIPPGRGIEFTITIPAGEEPFYSYDLIGRGEEDREARGQFSIMRPPPAPTKENTEPVTDEKLVAQIKAAQRILGKGTVTDDDLRTLRVEGRI